LIIRGPWHIKTAAGLPYTFLRPQYIYGPKSNKRYLDYFLGRALRKIHIPLPLHGEQLVALTHEEDVAALIAATLANPKAINPPSGLDGSA